MTELLQSTAQTVVGRGYLSSDHISTATGLDPAITISKNGGNFANPAAGASVMTEIESTGWYKFALGTGDTDTLGPLIIRGTHATMDNIEVVFQVVAVSVAQTGDSYAVVAHADYGNAKLVRSTTPTNTLTVDASHQALALTNAVTNDAITAAAIANGAIDAATFAAGAIDAAAIATGAIDADAIADGAIDNGALAADAISAAKIAADVTTELQSGLATATAALILATPANKLTTDASGRVEVSGTKTTLDALNDAPDVSADVGSIKGTTDKLDTALELDGAVYRLTADALEQAQAAATAALNAYDPPTATELTNGLAALNDITVADIIAGISEGTLDLQEMLRIILAAVAGKASGGGTATIKFRDQADTLDRITATVDANGNRTAVTVDGS